METTGVAVGLKWPNDVMGRGGKLGGVLSEASEGVVVVGLGINLWWPEPPPGIAALHDQDPGGDAAADLATRWARALLERVAGVPEAWGRDEYVAVCVTLGADITWEPGGAGTAVDIAEDGRLVVDTTSGRVALGSGEVTTLQPATLPHDHEETPG